MSEKKHGPARLWFIVDEKGAHVNITHRKSEIQSVEELQVLQVPL